MPRQNGGGTYREAFADDGITVTVFLNKIYDVVRFHQM